MMTKTINHLFILGLLSCGLLSGGISSVCNAQEENADTPTPPPPAAKDLAVEQMQMLAKSLPTAQVVWLKEADKDFLAVQTAARKPTPNGWVILLHDAGQHPRWPGPLSELQEFLPDKGWHTLAIALPGSYSPKPPPRPTAAELANSRAAAADGEAIEPEVGANEANEIFDDSTNTISDGSAVPETSEEEKQDPATQENKALDRIVAAMDFVATQNTQTIVLYGQGLGATRAAHYLIETGNTNKKIKALVLLNAENHAPGAEMQLLDALTNPDFPILDMLTLQTDKTLSDALARQHEAQRKGLKYYRQPNLIMPPHDNVSRVVYGFLQRLTP